MPMHPAIAETISFGSEAPLPTGTQPAFHAVVHLVIPGTMPDGTPINDVSACDYVAESLRDQFLDWSYVTGYENGDDSTQTPIQITVCQPYVEGTFIDSVES